MFPDAYFPPAYFSWSFFPGGADGETPPPPEPAPDLTGRVWIIDKSTEWGGEGGQTLRIVGPLYMVRVDGMGSRKTVPFRAEQLGESDYPGPFVYR